MIEKLKEHDIIDPKTDSVIGTMSCDSREIMDKVNELVDTVNELQTRAENVQPDAETRSENVCEPITLIDMFNEMGRLYADLWNKMEDIHHELRNKGGDNEL